MELAKKDAFVGLRLSTEELQQLDLHAQGQLSRSQIVRAAIQDFLDRPEKEQRKILFKRLFDK